jgi:putative ABC transport system permease protein
VAEREEGEVRCGYRAQGTGHRAQGTEHRAQGTGHRAQGTEHRATKRRRDGATERLSD